MSGENPRYEVLSGTISQLQTRDAHVHYLNNAKRQKEIAGTVAIVQAAMEQAGAVNSSHVANDEGDPVVAFSMQVAGKNVCGSFWEVTFKNDDHVHVIGQERAGIFEAMAVVKPEERVIWMQPHCERGTRSQARKLVKFSIWCILFALFCALLLVLFRDWPMWAASLTLTTGTLVVLFFTVGMSWGDFMIFARQTNAVCLALGLSEPENTDLLELSRLARKQGKPALPMGVYYF